MMAGRRRADLRQDALSTARRSSFAVAVRGAEARHRHGLPGDQPGAVDDRGAEHLPRRREVLQPPARHLHRRPAVPAVAQLPRRSDRDRRHASAPAKKQMVEIARAVHHNAEVIIFDEPTATLTPEEKRHFFALMRAAEAARRLHHLHLATRWRRRCRIADRITVLRDGEHGRHRRRPRASTATRSSAPWSAARCPASSTATRRDAAARAGRQEGAVGAEHLDGQRRCATIPSRSSRARSPACSA